MLKIVNVVAAIIKDGDKIYIAQRAGGSFKGGWEFPGGKIEPGESPEDAIKREIMEELAIEIDIIDKIGIVDYDYPDFHINMQCFLCEITNGAPMLSVHENAKWINLKDIDAIKLLPADMEIIKKIKSL